MSAIYVYSRLSSLVLIFDNDAIGCRWLWLLLTAPESPMASFRVPHPGGGGALIAAPRMGTPDAHEPAHAIEAVQSKGREFTAAIVDKSLAR